MNENELRDLIRSSPDDGFRQVFEQYHGYAYAIVCRTLAGAGSVKDAEDCIVDVFADVIMHFDTGVEGSLRAYIGTTARNKALNLKRLQSSSRRSRISDDEVLEIPDKAVNIEKKAENTELLNIVMDRIDKLGEPDSSIIISKYIYGRSSNETASFLGMSAANVRMRLSRAMKRLKGELDDLGVTLD